jgi:hypothetical protein
MIVDQLTATPALNFVLIALPANAEGLQKYLADTEEMVLQRPQRKAWPTAFRGAGH